MKKNLAGKKLYLKHIKKLGCVITSISIIFSGAYVDLDNMQPKNVYAEENKDIVSAINAWNGTVDTSWYNNAKNDFEIHTPQELAGLAQLVNKGNTFAGKKIILKSDLFFNSDESSEKQWLPIASEQSEVEFQGTFDGQGHTLYNLYVSADYGGGLFGLIGENGIVKAVKISQSTFKDNGAIASENNGWIIFCENNSKVLNLEDKNAGGICGINKNLIYGCCNTGEVYDGGGIAGINQEASSCIDSCWNSGYVECDGHSAAGIVLWNYGWIYDCYNSGIICGGAKTIAGISGSENGTIVSMPKIRNCYNIGTLYINEEENWYASDAICGGSEKSACGNVYTLPTEYNGCKATELTLDEFKSVNMINNLQDNSPIQKWSEDTKQLNNGVPILTAQKDMTDGCYKIMPDVWYPKTEVFINLSDVNYEFKGFKYAYYGINDAKAVYSTDSDVLSITSEGIITPHKYGTAIVNVKFEETEHTKEVSYNVKVTVKKPYITEDISYEWDVNSDETINISKAELLSNITEIIIPEEINGKAVTTISDNAFSGCNSIESIRIPKSIISINESILEMNNNIKIYGYMDSYAEQYASENNISFIAILESSDNITLEVPTDILPTDVALETKLLTSGDEEYKNINFVGKLADTTINPSDVKFTAYKITLTDMNNSEIQPSEMVKIIMPCPQDYNGELCKVYSVNEDGTFTDMRADYSDGEFIFETENISTYIITETELITGDIYISGDADGDGEVTSADAVIIKKYLAGYSDLNIDEEASDVDRDGEITSGDAVLVLKYLAGYDVELK